MSGSIDCWLTNRDLLEFPRQMAEQLAGMNGVGRITIVDCGSTYPPLLDWYHSCEFDVYLGGNEGNHAPWRAPLHLCSGQTYFASDADLDLSGCGKNMLLDFQDALNWNENVIKVGVSLRIDDLPDVKMSKSVILHESKFWQKEHGKSWFEADIDTVGCSYRRGSGWRGYSPALRSRVHIARHMPWYVTEPAEDMKHYLKHMRVQGLTWGPRLKEAHDD